MIHQEIYHEESGVETKRGMLSVPIEQKFLLTIPEAAAYSNIGQNKISKMLNTANCPFALFVGTKRLVKREEFEKFISTVAQF